jgi:hypothetical protein
MNCKTCPVCGATWIDGQLYWSGTKKPGKDEDLNALVCRRLAAEKATGCVNPCKGSDGGEGWEDRIRKTEAALLKLGL